jgi:hypothetical protein
VSRPITPLEIMAGTTRLELATSAVTGQRSNQLNYVPIRQIKQTIAVVILTASLGTRKRMSWPSFASEGFTGADGGPLNEVTSGA